MQNSNLFMAELSVGSCRISSPLDKKINLTFRIGKNAVHSTYPKTIEEGSIHFNTILQLNTDKLALETQRCSLALNTQNEGGQQPIIAFALINIPKKFKVPQKNYKLTQCSDKNAEIELSLRIVSLDEVANSSDRESSSHIKDSQTSMRQILEMKEFQKVIISPPDLFKNKSSISQSSNHFYLAPPKPRQIQERGSNSLTMSICSQAIEEVRAQSLEKQCSCLKELLRLQIQKNQEANKLINFLQQTLKQVNIECHQNVDIDETFLLQENSQCSQKALEQKIIVLNSQIVELTAKNESLMKQNKQLQGLILKLSDYAQQNLTLMQNQKPNLGDTKNNHKSLLKRLQASQRSIIEWQKKFQRLKSQIGHLQQTLQSKQDQYERFKKKMKIQQKFSSLKHIEIQKSSSLTHTIKMMMQRQINEKKELLKLLLRYTKQQNEGGSGVLQKIKMKVERSFNALTGKRLSRQILMAQKGELLKFIEEFSPKFLGQ